MSADLLLHVLEVATIASTVAVLLVLALRKPMRHQFGAQAAYASWCVVPLSAAIALLPAPVATVTLAAVGATTSRVLLPLPGAAVQVPWHFDATPWLAALWLIGVVMRALWFMRQQRRFLRALGPLSPGADGQVLRARTTAGCPALVGAWQPRIIVPADFDERFSAIERALIVTHEQLHRTRGDAQANLFAAALRCLFWFNPLVHFAASRFRFDQELACDALVIARFPEARRPYADAMLKTQLAGESRQEPGLPVGCYWQSSHPLKERITMLKLPLPGRARSALGVSLAVLLGVGGGYAAWAAQPANLIAAAYSAGTGSIHADLTLSVDGAPLDTSWSSRTHSGGFMQHDGSSAPSAWQLGIRAGEPFSLAVERPGESWELDGNASPNGGDTIALDSVLKHNDAVVGSPKLIVHDGEAAGIRIGEESAGGAFKGFAAQITLARADRGDSAANTPAHATGETTPLSGASDSRATYRSMHRIAYPPAQVAAKVEGVVYVKVHIGTDGDVVSAIADRFEPDTAVALANAATSGIRTCRFNPAERAGKPVASDEIIPVVFALHPDAVRKTSSAGTLDAIRVSPPDEPLAATANRPPTEDVTFRDMHAPKYPEEAVRNKQSAKLMFKVLVDEHGAPQSVDIEHSDPPAAEKIFAQASIDAIMQWRFNPAIKDGKPHDGYVEVPITFSLKDDE
ncbi:MAG TPA: TonB family protein [Rudaea sp.]|jgi:TonB family protein